MQIFVESQHTQTKFRRQSVDYRNQTIPRTDAIPICVTQLPIGFMADYSSPTVLSCYCEKHLLKLLILGLTEFFVADESYYLQNPNNNPYLFSFISFFEHDLYFTFHKQDEGRDSSVGVETSYRLERPEFESQ
jgi:hypothetical protein